MMSMFGDVKRARMLILGFPGQPPSSLNRPTKNLRFFQSSQKILKSCRNTILRSVITNIYSVFRIYTVVVVKSIQWAV
jgi:hypothetical protein